VGEVPTHVLGGVSMGVRCPPMCGKEGGPWCEVPTHVCQGGVPYGGRCPPNAHPRAKILAWIPLVSPRLGSSRRRTDCCLAHVRTCVQLRKRRCPVHCPVSQQRGRSPDLDVTRSCALNTATLLSRIFRSDVAASRVRHFSHSCRTSHG
jgi:hypothetical protein